MAPTWVFGPAVRAPFVSRNILDQVLQHALVARLLPLIQERRHSRDGFGGAGNNGDVERIWECGGGGIVDIAGSVKDSVEKIPSSSEFGRGGGSLYFGNELGDNN